MAYTYSWTWDEEVFDLAGPLGESTLFVTVKDGKDLDAIVSPISVTVTDENGCSTTKTCYYTPTGMQCGEYIPCPNAANLIIINKFVRCTGASQLKVSKTE